MDIGLIKVDGIRNPVRVAEIILESLKVKINKDSFKVVASLKENKLKKRKGFVVDNSILALTKLCKLGNFSICIDRKGEYYAKG